MGLWDLQIILFLFLSTCYIVSHVVCIPERFISCSHQIKVDFSFSFGGSLYWPITVSGCRTSIWLPGDLWCSIKASLWIAIGADGREDACKRARVCAQMCSSVHVSMTAFSMTGWRACRSASASAHVSSWGPAVMLAEKTTAINDFSYFKFKTKNKTNKTKQRKKDTFLRDLISEEKVRVSLNCIKQRGEALDFRGIENHISSKYESYWFLMHSHLQSNTHRQAHHEPHKFA